MLQSALVRIYRGFRALAKKIDVVTSTVNTVDTFASWIANPDPNRPIQAAVSAAGRRVCDSLSNAPAWANNPAVKAINPWQTICDPYWNQEGISPPTLVDPGFSGGQCPGATYTVNFVTSGAQRLPCNGFPQFFDDFDPNQAITNCTGPITAVEIVAGGSQFFCNRTGRNEFDQAIARVVHAGGTSTRVLLGSSTGATYESFTFTTQVIRTDGGGPDDCGDPESTVEPGPTPAPDPGPFPSGEDPGVGPDGQPFFYVPDIEQPIGEDYPVPDNPFTDTPTGSGGDTVTTATPGESIGVEDFEPSSGEPQFTDLGDPGEGFEWIGGILFLDKVEGEPGIVGPASTGEIYPRVVGNIALFYDVGYGTSERITSQWTGAFRPPDGPAVTAIATVVPVGTRASFIPFKVPVQTETSD